MDQALVPFSVWRFPSSYATRYIHQHRGGAGTLLSRTQNSHRMPPGLRYIKSADFGNVEHGHRSGVTAVAFSPGGKELASAGLDAKLCVWSVSHQRLIHVFVGASPILSVVWIPNEQGQLICGAQDGSITLITTSAVRLRTIAHTIKLTVRVPQLDRTTCVYLPPKA